MKKVVLRIDRCKGCYNCVHACAKSALSPSEVLNKKGYLVVQIDETNCVTCGNCYKVCPDYVFEIAETAAHIQ